jgi:5-methylcytosine-specific restriction endonuclease McrA
MEIDNTFRNQRKKNKKKYVPLTEAEKQRRNDLGLCVYCGSSDHEIENCNVKPAKRTLNAVYNVTSKNKIPKKGNSKILYSFQDFQLTQSQ